MLLMNVCVGMAPATTSRRAFAEMVASSGVVEVKRNATSTASLAASPPSSGWLGGGMMCGAHAAQMQFAFCFECAWLMRLIAFCCVGPPIARASRVVT